MLAKKTSKNQITIPKAIVAEFSGIDYFEVSTDKGCIVLEPVSTRPAKQLRDKLAELGIKEKDVRYAIKKARENAE